MLAPGWGTGTRGGSPPGVKPVSVLVGRATAGRGAGRRRRRPCGGWAVDDVPGAQQEHGDHASRGAVGCLFWFWLLGNQSGFAILKMHG